MSNQGNFTPVSNSVDSTTAVIESLGITQVDTKTPEQTFGQRAVNARFNPSELTEVDDIKNAIAGIIDIINERQFTSYLGNNFKGMAIRSLITASSDTVRVLTTSEN